ncbi:hypothetical protein D3C87_269730 [compost metagenome]
MSNMTNNSLISSTTTSAQIAFEQTPPYPVKYWVQKLATPTSRGENLIFRVKYESDSKLPMSIDLYGNSVSIQYKLRDDGRYPDDIAGDGKYACLKKENINALLSEINSLATAIKNARNVVRFRGHTGEVVSFKELLTFNKDAFLANQEVEIDALLIEADLCANEIKLEKSLFITDLSVVEDQTRTYNLFTGVGNPNGAWTFGTLMANMENGNHADGVRGFLKDWIKQWTTDQTIGNHVVKARKHVLECLISPWLRKAQGNTNLTVTLQNWESLWDATPGASLKQTAPFKLSTIVNRIDLRGNSAYTASFADGGETRFIFSLIDPYTGNIAMSPDQPFSQQMDGVGFGDWRGLNVIMEFGNIQTEKCDVLDLAQEWLDLSDASFSFGTASANNAYKTALQHITDYVTTAGASTGRINGSAINRIRTNEKAFADRDLSLEVHLGWARQDWEFRQFELDPVTHGFKLVPLSNNPPITSNAAPNIDEDFSGTSQPVINDNLLSWIYGGNKLKVKRGNFNMPSFLLAGTAVVTSEAAHYYDFNRDNWITKSPAYASVTFQNGSEEAKQIRQQFSLNTCIGCHNGDTKTRFMHVNTLAYNEPARYWLSTLDGNNVIQDKGSYPWGTSLNEDEGFNSGSTLDDNFSNFPNYTVAEEFYKQNFYQAVSPFLTGRRYRAFTAESGRQPSWQDDEKDDSNIDNFFMEEPDHQMKGLFYVADPSNSMDLYFPYKDDRKWGYNDLLMRKKGLCNFLVNGCHGVLGEQDNPSSISLIRSIAFIPLPLAAH